MSIEDKMNRYGWTDIWHPSLNSWLVGFWHTEFDLICVKHCGTEAEAEKSLSPEGATIKQAMELAIRKLERIAELRRHVKNGEER